MTNLYALIVGIEKYHLPNWNRSGPVAGALQMASWCTSIGASTKNIFMFLSVDETEPSRVLQHTHSLSQFKQMGITVNQDTSLNAIETFWRETLPKLPSGDSKLLVYWCGHGVTRSDRDRILLHTDYRPDNLSSRVTSVNNLRATLSTQTYQKFKEQLIVADACGDFAGYATDPNVPQPKNPVASITQHCYLASVDGQNTLIENGIGQFTQSTLNVLNQYQEWPDLKAFYNRMDETFPDGGNRPFKIFIGTPEIERDDLKATPAEKSSSQSPVPPKKPLEFFRLQVVNLLKGNDEVTKNFYNLLASDEERVKSDVVADHLVRLDDSNTTEYPLLRLRRLMKKLSDQRLILDHSYRTVFVSMMDILSVASFPNEDRDRMENAMLEVLRSNPEIGSKVQLTTALPEDVKRLLILTRLKLASQKFDDFAIDRILNNDYQEGESGSPLFEIVRPVIIPEPFILPPDGRSITSYYAEKILETFNSTMPRTDFEGCLTHELKERKGLEGDGEVIALLLSNEASKNAQILQKAFPLLLVIVLQRENALRYDTVLLDRNEIEKMLKKMLRNPQK
jgi:hypothetical protein